MYKSKKYLVLFTVLISIFMLVTTVSLIFPTSLKAQYWAPLPPYNVLWPLWSPALSPVDPVTGVATPLISSLTGNTILPVQPCLVWDPYQTAVEPFPWLLYNTPTAFGSGLVYWDVYYGLNPWPPNYLLDPVSGGPAPITLPATWTLLGPTDDYGWFVPLANALFSYQYGVPVSSLLTSADIWGYPPLATLPSPII